MTLTFFTKYRHVIIYGVALALLMFVLKWLEWRFLIFDYAVEIYAGLIAVFFTGLGIWLALKLTRPKTIIVEKEVAVMSTTFVLNKAALEQTGLSMREMEVLQCMANGLSNQQIAEQLFVSLNTVKTHTSRIFEKLEVQRRTQAVEKAKQLSLISR